MHYRQLGGTELRVSELCLGSAWFGVAPLADDVDALMGTALDGGITFFDTACSYGNQSRFDRPQAPPAHERASAEELLGRALKGHRDDVVLASKVGERIDPNGARGGREHVEKTLAQTLRRLQTDHLDVYYVHHPDPARIGRAPYSAQQLSIADQLQQLADEHEASPPRLSLGWLLTRPGVVSTVIGPESGDELAPTIEQFSRPVDERLLAEVDALTRPSADLN